MLSPLAIKKQMLEFWQRQYDVDSKSNDWCSILKTHQLTNQITQLTDEITALEAAKPPEKLCEQIIQELWATIKTAKHAKDAEDATRQEVCKELPPTDSAENAETAQAPASSSPASSSPASSSPASSSIQHAHLNHPHYSTTTHSNHMILALGACYWSALPPRALISMTFCGGLCDEGIGFFDFCGQLLENWDADTASGIAQGLRVPDAWLAHRYLTTHFHSYS